ncbi:hypothetical protein [Telluribacter sp. SYSU D00476]|uniref:hypothetical protein n=1 Tax=Telluribacter sp. SYSU D00476 TaxID=2811430 RepID=UPI001FF6D183|nr:hypothetical protein [Telluribacter sp. SYSU D00476]
MIQFDFIHTFDSSVPIDWLLVLFLLLLPVVQVGLVLRQRAMNPRRRWLRIALNLTLWLVLVGYVFQPVWTTYTDSDQVLLVADDVPADFVRWVQDSLGIGESLTVDEFLEAQENGGAADSVVLVGQAFPPEVLGQLSDRSLRWVPYMGPDQWQDLGWKGVVRRGDKQRVQGSILSSKEQWLRLRFGNHTLDSVRLERGENTFQLEFPAFSEGRTETLLELDDLVLDTLRYYSRPALPLHFHFLLDSPDFESRTLAHWLGKQGHHVQVAATPSRDMRSSLRINTAGKGEVDVVITDPGHASHPLVRKAMADGRSVLFMNLIDPASETNTLNRSLGTSWRVRKTSNESTVSVGTNLTALPYTFGESLLQTQVPTLPVAVQRTAGKVGVSLLTETFPLQLSGDSTAYKALWTAVFAELQPSGKENIQVQAPLFSGIRQPLYFNNFAKPSATAQLGADTLHLHYSPLNALTAVGTYLPGQPGWMSLPDSTEIYVEHKESMAQVRQTRQVREYLRAHAQYRPALSTTQSSGQRDRLARVPDWLWLVLLVLCFTALWVEPRWRPA